MFSKIISRNKPIGKTLKLTALALCSTLLLSTASAEVTFHADFNKGTPASNGFVGRGNFTTIKNGAANFVLDRFKSGLSYRTEVILDKRAGHFDFGKEYWLSFDYRYEDWKKDSKSAESAPFQIHTTPSKSQAEGCRVLSPSGSNSARGTAPIFMSSKNGQVEIGTYGGKVRWTGPLEHKKWLNLVVHFKMSASSDGFIEVWKDGKKLFRNNGANAPKLDSCKKPLRAPVLKFGVYKWNWDKGCPKSNPQCKPLTDSTRRELLMDNIKIGTGFPDNVGNPPKKDTKAPSVPSNLKITGTTTINISLNWKASTDNIAVAGYDVHYTEANSSNAQVRPVSGTNVKLTGLTPNLQYSIKVRAKDAAGNKSAYSSSQIQVTNAIVTTPNYTVSYTAGKGGKITGKTTQTVKKGKSATSVTAVANSGYTFVKWSDGKTSATRTDANITSNLTATATFKKDTTSPVIIANAGKDKLFTCKTIYRTVGNADNGRPASSNGATYSWTTTDGHIRAGANAKVAEVDMAGTYKLTVSKAGSTSVSDSVIVTDEIKNCDPIITLPDFDKDGTPDATDNDDDNDGVQDTADAFPFNSSESVDTDNDGTGNNADSDDDNDGYTDAEEIAAGTDPLNKGDKPASEPTEPTDNKVDEESSAGSFPIGLLMLGILVILRRK
jgi:hypothetical protein